MSVSLGCDAFRIVAVVIAFTTGCPDGASGLQEQWEGVGVLENLALGKANAIEQLTSEEFVAGIGMGISPAF